MGWSRQGIITSGLNHLAHSALEAIGENISFKQQLKNKGIKPNGRFGFTEEEFIRNINAVKEVRDLAILAESKIEGYELVQEGIVVMYQMC